MREPINERDTHMKTGDENKFDGGKMMWHIVPIKPLMKVVDVLNYGANKYKEEGWKEVSDPKDRYYNALVRHLVAWKGGEQYDPESGKHHLAHVGCNVLFLLWFDSRCCGEWGYNGECRDECFKNNNHPKP